MGGSSNEAEQGEATRIASSGVWEGDNLAAARTSWAGLGCGGVWLCLSGVGGEAFNGGVGRQ